MKIKVHYILFFALTAMTVLSCKKDTYAPPALTLTGKLVYKGEALQLQYNQIGYELYQYGFGLVGAHARLKCADCHRQPAAEVKLSSECISCHQKDDVHDGQFGRRCERCHTTVTFQGGRAR